jgi:hypothetical protein
MNLAQELLVRIGHYEYRLIADLVVSARALGHSYSEILTEIEVYRARFNAPAVELTEDALQSIELEIAGNTEANNARFPATPTNFTPSNFAITRSHGAPF